MRVRLKQDVTRYRIRVNATEFSEGDPVDTPDGVGVVVEVRDEDFDGPDGAVEASSDSPAYVVGLESAQKGVAVFRADDLSDADLPETDVDPVETVAEEEMSDNLRANDFTYPRSWRKSEKPNRLILLDMWASMGGQFDCGGACCKGEMISSGMSNRAANQFCASAKDKVLGGWEGWRGG
jgi:hypothetical protein